ncbi:serine hydrolase domain-containing protein [Pseudonocardia sp. HH130630-07]|uniref:serine hydrolase domain-containing protein n=1 Tax=Pseudonocardia sp. HH130630-07 TaxID=1690815 RepID=UPI0008152800|nr:serine hydrolase domain-containing protein [Pseudonocardia sp. HH130630-07]ANY07832.1 hypothetical protein AFB00_17730 [Pseudonocardia sp. HH130630-07]
MRAPGGALTDLLAGARADGVFSAAAWAVGDADGHRVRGTLGTRAWPDLPEVTGAGDGIDAAPLDGTELFDLASVTKPLVALAAAVLVERGALADDDTVARLLPAHRGTPAADATLAQLLLHTSGLPGRVPLWREHGTREALLRAVAELPLAHRPGTQVDYSSQGFILIGLMLEAATGAPLDELVTDLVAGPAGARGLTFAPGPGVPVVATERCAWRGRVVQGQVHDENAVVLGRPAGHAGLFGTLDDVAAVGRALVRTLDDRVLMSPAALAAMIRTDSPSPARSRGWQNNDPAEPVAGGRVGPRTFGHTGFTGTSLFVDPDTRRWYVLLTNRVHVSREGTGVVAVRARFHDLAHDTAGG